MLMEEEGKEVWSVVSVGVGLILWVRGTVNEAWRDGLTPVRSIPRRPDEASLKPRTSATLYGIAGGQANDKAIGLIVCTSAVRAGGSGETESRRQVGQLRRSLPTVMCLWHVEVFGGGPSGGAASGRDGRRSRARGSLFRDVGRNKTTSAASARHACRADRFTVGRGNTTDKVSHRCVGAVALGRMMSLCSSQQRLTPRGALIELATSTARAQLQERSRIS
jgi:hypothetical protein